MSRGFYRLSGALKRDPERSVTVTLSVSEQTDLMAACLLAITTLRADAELVKQAGAGAVGLGALLVETDTAAASVAPEFYLLERARELEMLKDKLLHAESH